MSDIPTATDPSGQSIYLPTLDMEITADAVVLPDPSNNELPVADCIAHFNLSVEYLQGLFQYQTDGIDVTNQYSTDVQFRLMYTIDASGNVYSIDASDSTYALGIDINNAVYLENQIGGDSSFNTIGVGPDFVRYLAEQLFSDYNGTDLIQNEEEIRDNLNTTFKDTLHTNLLNEQSFISSLDPSSSSITKSVFLSLIEQPARFRDIANMVAAIENDQTWYKMPIVEGDKFAFLLTINPADGQANLVNVYNGVDAIPPIEGRIYRIQINATA